MPSHEWLYQYVYRDKAAGGSFVQTEKIATDLNRRPRKSLGWFTPDEVMAGFYSVALRS